MTSAIGAYDKKSALANLTSDSYHDRGYGCVQNGQKAWKHRRFKANA